MTGPFGFLDAFLAGVVGGATVLAARRAGVWANGVRGRLGGWVCCRCEECPRKRRVIANVYRRRRSWVPRRFVRFVLAFRPQEIIDILPDLTLRWEGGIADGKTLGALNHSLFGVGHSATWEAVVESGETWEQVPGEENGHHYVLDESSLAMVYAGEERVPAGKAVLDAD